MTYLNRLYETCNAANKSALKSGDGIAWDNKKAKTRKRYCPRGSFFKKFEKVERKAEFNRIVRATDFKF